MKNRAVGYTDFYKNAPANQTPGSKIKKTPEYGTPEVEDKDAKTAAVKRRLKKVALGFQAKAKKAGK